MVSLGLIIIIKSPYGRRKLNTNSFTIGNFPQRQGSGYLPGPFGLQFNRTIGEMNSLYILEQFNSPEVHPEEFYLSAIASTMCVAVVIIKYAI